MSGEAGGYRRDHFDVGSPAGKAIDLEPGRDGRRPFAHATQTESQQIATLYKADAVVFHAEGYGLHLELEQNIETAGGGVADSVSDGLLADAEQFRCDVRWNFDGITSGGDGELD